MNNLRITTTDAKLGIQTTNGNYNISQPKGQQNIKQTDAKINIDKENTRVIIDTYEQRADRGLKNNLDLLIDAKNLGKQSTLQAIGRIVADGNRMANITKNMPPAVPELAKKNSNQPMRQFNSVLSHVSKPKIDVAGHLNINWDLGGTEVSYQVQKPQISYTKGQVDIYMKQDKDITIENIDIKG